GDVATAAAIHRLQHGRIERLRARAAGQLPGNAQPPRLEQAAELEDPVALDDRREIVEVDVLGAVLAYKLGDLVDHTRRRASGVAGGPHLRTRTERAAVRTAAGGEQRHGATAIDAEAEAPVEIALDRGQVPTRCGNVVDVANARPRRGAGRAIVGAEDDAGQVGQRPAADACLDQLDRGLLAFAEGAGHQRRSVVQALLGYRRRVFAAAYDGHAGEARGDRSDQRADDRPLVREQTRDAHPLRIGSNAGDDLGNRQPVDDDVRTIPGMHGSQRFADPVDDLHLVARRAQAAGEIGQR